MQSNSIPLIMLSKDEKKKLAEKVGFMKREAISEEMELLRKYFGGTTSKIPTDSKFVRELFDREIGQLDDEHVSMRVKERRQKE